jgi:diguanylate cyclase (GGDEF)-like protein
MSTYSSLKRIQKVKRQTIGITMVFITILIFSFYLFASSRLFESLIARIISMGMAAGIIGVTFRQIQKLQSLLDDQLAHQTALMRLSEVFATTHEEEKIYSELVHWLGEVHGYDHIAIYRFDPTHNSRILRASTTKNDEASLLHPGNGLSERPILDGKLHYSPNISIEPNYVPGIGCGSEIDAPIHFHEDILGVLVVESKEVDAFHQADFELISATADQAAIAIKNALLFQETKNSADRLFVLHHVSQEVISAGTDPERIYKTIHRAAEQIMPCEAFAISIIDRQSGEIEAVYMFDRDGRTPSIRIPQDSGLSGHVISTGKAVLEHDYIESNGLKGINVIHFGNPDHTRAILAVPMRLGKNVFGMLSAQSYEPYIYSSEDQTLLEMLAAYAAIALDNAKLFSRVEHLAITDSLTDINNRRYFFDGALKELARSKCYGHAMSVIMLDLDDYKEINDAQGHVIGDLVLREVAQRLLSGIRASDILGRYGGDEFAILLPETNVEQAIELANRLRIYVTETPFQVENYSFNITISLGVSGTNGNTPSLIDLLRFADEALYEAKEAGKNCVRSRIKTKRKKR